MKLIIFLLLFCSLTGCTETDNTFYIDIECDGVPFTVRRFIVDKERQSVLNQWAIIFDGKVEEQSAHYLDNCTVSDTKNFICGDYSRRTIMSDGSLIEQEKYTQISNDSCVYKKGFWGYKKIADATVKDVKTLPLQNK